MPVKANRWFKIVNILLLLAIALIPGCEAEPKTSGPPVQHLNYALSATPAVLDTGKLSEKSEIQLANAILEGIVRLKPDGTFEEAMAESWEIDNKANRYTFKLRDSMWSNGEKVTAYDFEYAWKRALHPDNAGRYVYMLYTIKNAEGYHRSQNNEYRGKKYTREDVGIHAVDENTLVVELNKPDPVFINKLIYPVFFPLPQKHSEANPEEFFQPQNIQVNGPFKILQYETGIKYELVRNEKYWDKENVKLASMTWFLAGGEPQTSWQMYKNNRLDLTLTVPQSELAAGLKNNSILTEPLPVNYIYHFNTTKKPFDDVRVRRALSYALNRQSLIDNVLQGAQTPAAGLVPTGIPEQEAGGDFRKTGGILVLDNKPDEAKKLLSEAGYPDGQGFPAIELLINDQPEHYFLAVALKEEWQKSLGIEVVITREEWQKRVDRMQKRDYDFAQSGGVADLADAAAFLEKYSSRSSYNDTGWSNTEYDRLLRVAAASSDQERNAALHDAEKLLISELPVLPLYDYTQAYTVKNRLKGLYLPPVGAEAEFKWTYLD
jgi:oligopeptide transport system substrate-binding protein